MTAAHTDVASYVRGRLFIAGVSEQTSICDTLDVLTVTVMDVPVEQLKQWRTELDAALLKLQPATIDRATWGLLPDQVAATERLMGSLG